MPIQAVVIDIEIQIRRKELNNLVKINDLTSDVVLEKSRQIDDLVSRHYEICYVSNKSTLILGAK